MRRPRPAVLVACVAMLAACESSRIVETPDPRPLRSLLVEARTVDSVGAPIGGSSIYIFAAPPDTFASSPCAIPAAPWRPYVSGSALANAEGRLAILFEVRDSVGCLRVQALRPTGSGGPPVAVANLGLRALRTPVGGRPVDTVRVDVVFD